MFEIPSPPEAGGSDKAPGPDGDRPGPGYPMVPCLLSTKTPHWETSVSK